MLTRFSFLLVILYNIGCSKPAANIHLYNTKLLAAFADSNVNAVILNGRILCDLIGKEKDSLRTYVMLNKQISDSLFAWKDDEAAVGFLDNINARQAEITKDSSLIPFLAKSLLDRADHSFTDSYNDTVVQCYERALLLRKQYSFTGVSGFTNARKRLGISYHILGDKKKCYYYYNEAHLSTLELRKKYPDEVRSNNQQLASIIINKAEYFNDYHLFDSSISNIAPVLLMEGIDTIREGQLYTFLAEAYAGKNNNDSAAICIQQAIGVLKNENTQNQELISKLRDVHYVKAQIERKNHSLPDAINSIQVAAGYASRILPGQTDRYRGKVNILRSKLELETGNTDSAEWYAEAALADVVRVDKQTGLPAANAVYAENTIAEALDVFTEVLQKKYTVTGNRDLLKKAVACNELAIETERKLLQNFTYDDSKLALLTERLRTNQRAIDICYDLYKETNDPSWAEKAFQFSEKNKSFILLQSVKQNQAMNPLLQKDSSFQYIQSLQLSIAYNERKMARSDLPVETAQLNDQHNKLEAELLAAKTKLSRENTAYKTRMDQEDEISAKLVSTTLLDNATSMVEFFESRSNTYSFILNRDQPLVFKRYGPELDSLVNAVLFYFRDAQSISNQPLDYQQSAWELFQTLGLDDIKKKLIIIPDGRLNFLPFDALITSGQMTSNLKTAPYFIRQHECSYGYSAAIMLQQAAEDHYGGSGVSAFAPVSTISVSGLQPLLYAVTEVESISRSLKADLYVREQAGLQQFKKAMNNADIIHIATHAFADTNVSNGQGIVFYDSSLLLNELYALHTHASLVVLSACETGIGKLNKTEGPISIARGFYYAGAGSVITSYWNVNDKSTAILFGDFYANMDGQLYNAALYKAKMNFLQNATITSASPYFWAGFVYIGPPAKNKKNGFNPWWLLALAPLLLLLRRVGSKEFRVKS